VRIWARRQVKVGGRYAMDDGHIVVDSIAPITMREVTGALARESGFASRDDLLQVARHGRGGHVFLVRFHYLPPGAWDRKPANAPHAIGRTETAVVAGAGTSRTGAARRSRESGFNLVRTLSQTLPGVEESTSYGKPSLKVQGRMFACLASHRSAEPNTLVVRVDSEQRDDLIADDPTSYYLTEHYVSYPCVLVRLSRIHRDALRDLLSMGWRFVSKRHARQNVPGL
jgi:hypothetical protein